MNSVRYVSSGITFLDGEILYIELPGDDYAVPSNVLYVQGVRARLVEKDLAPKVNYFAGCTIALYSSIVCYILLLSAIFYYCLLYFIPAVECSCTFS
jgi:hypothetical protein